MINPSYECMRVAREESRAELLEMRRLDVAQMLKEVEFGEGSHENLSAIANVIYEPCFGWTKSACEYLRDQLVYLIGGERDAQHGCSDGAGGCDCRHESEEVGYGISGGDCGVREVRHNRDLCDMGDCHVSKAALMTYDVLGNERHKAVCELRKLDLHSNSVTNNQMAIANALGVDFDGGELFSDAMRHRLIHLLGGDQPASSDLRGIQKDRTDDGTCPNDVPTASVTSELREYVCIYETTTTVYATMPLQMEDEPTRNGQRLLAIADRIDAQFAEYQKIVEALALVHHGILTAYKRLKEKLNE